MDKKEPENDATKSEISVVSAPKVNALHRFKRWYGNHKKLSIPLTIVALLAVLLAIPYTRYLVVGTVWRQNFTIKVLDTETGKPVSSAIVKINGKDTTTNGQGEVTLHLNVGTAKLHIEKKYYQTSETNVLVPIFKQKHLADVNLKATGRQITVTIVNKINQKPVSEATVSALDTKAKTDRNGQAILVIPADKQTATAIIEANGFVKTTADIKVTADMKANKVALTPAGQVYFLSNASGKIDVVKTNLDGSDRKIVLAGTGKENKNNTILLASRDWKYLALLSHRDDGTYNKVYLIDTTNGDELTAIDEGEADFIFVGWSDHRFVYNVRRANKQPWETNFAALKSFDATTKKIVTLDQDSGEGTPLSYLFTSTDATFILKDEVVYTKIWQTNYTPQAIQTLKGKKSELRSVKPDGSNNHVAASYGYSLPPNASETAVIPISARQYEPQGIWIKQAADKTEEYENGAIKQITNVSQDEFDAGYPTYLISPNGTMTFWQKLSDGKNVLSVGDSDAKNSKEVAKATTYNVYGWYTDDYLLVTKDSSELYIMPAAGGTPTKLTDYYKPPISFRGYGSGYGGL